MGSTTKLFTYTAAIASTKFTMTTPILDDYYAFPIPGSPSYKPYDDDRRIHGVCQLKSCLGNSLNIPAVKTEYATGTQYIANTELAMGVPSLEQNCGKNDQSVNWPGPYNWAATLGSLTCGITLLDLADGAATLGDLGVEHNPMPVTKIVAEGTGQTVWTYNATAAGRQVIPANVAFIMDEITSNDNNRTLEFGRNGPLTLNPRRVSAKTGTAEFYLDNLTVGWTPNLLTAVWVGNEQQSCLQPKDDAYMAKRRSPGATSTMTTRKASAYPFSPHDLAHYGLQPAHPSTPDCGHLDGVISGYSGAAPIWHAYMLAALKGVPDTWYTPPPDLITVSTGQGFDDSNFYLPGTGPDAPAGQCTYYGVTPLPTQTCTYAGPGGGTTSAHHEPEPVARGRPHADTFAVAHRNPPGRRLGAHPLLAGALPHRIEVLEDRELWIGARCRGRHVPIEQRRERGVHMADDDVVARRTAFDLVEPEERPPVVERDVGGGGEHGRVREQRQFGVLGAAREHMQQLTESLAVDLGIDDDPARSVGGLLVDHRVIDSDGVELPPELSKIEHVRPGAEHAEAFPGDRVQAGAVTFGDADDERLGTERSGGERRPDDLSLANSQVGIERALLDSLRFGARCRLVGNNRGPLLEVDANSHPVPRVQAIEKAAIESAEGHLRLDRHGAPAWWHRVTIAQTHPTDSGVRGVRSVD